MKTIFSILLLLVLSSFTSCDRMKRRGDVIVNDAKDAVRSRKEAVIDKVFKPFDSYKPDTKNNKARFKQFFGFTPTDDVKNLYAFGDELGIDSKYQFAFVCDSSTKRKIVSDLGLLKADKPDNFGAGLWRSYPWWDSAAISQLVPYMRTGERQSYQYLWYDDAGSTLYYSEFDL